MEESYFSHYNLFNPSSTNPTCVQVAHGVPKFSYYGPDGFNFTVPTKIGKVATYAWTWYLSDWGVSEINMTMIFPREDFDDIHIHIGLQTEKIPDLGWPNTMPIVCVVPVENEDKPKQKLM